MTTANALEASQIFVLLFTASAALSKDIAKELAAATLENKLIIPVRLENIAPQGRLSLRAGVAQLDQCL